MEGTREGRWRDGIAVKGEEGGDGEGRGDGDIRQWSLFRTKKRHHTSSTTLFGSTCADSLAAKKKKKLT